MLVPLLSLWVDESAHDGGSSNKFEQASQRAGKMCEFLGVIMLITASQRYQKLVLRQDNHPVKPESLVPFKITPWNHLLTPDLEIHRSTSGFSRAHL